jgi:hypothetical protein
VGNGIDDTAWGGCSVPDTLTTLQSLPHSSCDPYCATPIYTGGTTIAAYASLPTNGGGVIAYSAGKTATALNLSTIWSAFGVKGLPKKITSLIHFMTSMKDIFANLKDLQDLTR